jgi:diguanylate cyclase (GGDEF)-like protein
VSAREHAPSVTLGDIALPAARVPRGELGAEVERRFRANPTMLGVIVDCENGRVGLIARAQIHRALSGPAGYGWALYAKRPIELIADRAPIVMSHRLSLPEAATELIGRLESLADWPEVVVVERADDLAIAPVIRIFQALSEAYSYKIAQLDEQVRFDALTGLPNRRHLVGHLRDLMERRVAVGGRAVLYVDIDRFKTINDSLGHGAGDLVLIEVARRLRTVFRDDDLVARVGGDEFVIVAAIGEENEARTLAQRVLDAFRQPVPLDHHNVFVTASIGVETLSPDATSADEVLRNADLAMYQAKQSGRDRAATYEDGLLTAAHDRLSFETLLRESLVRQELTVHYQPIVRLADLATIGYEALARWQTEQTGPIPPGVFIPIAEEIGMINAIGSFVLASATRQLVDWRIQRRDDRLRVAVNVSARQVAGESLQRDIETLLSAITLDPKCLTLEITESILVAESGSSLRQLEALRDLGVGIAIDDFGVGYSSLSYLRRFPITEIKIDRSFVADIVHDDFAHELVCAVVAMGHAVGASITAEGVETAEQLALVRESGCDNAQGYFLGRPQPAEEIDRRQTSTLRGRSTT